MSGPQSQTPLQALPPPPAEAPEATAMLLGVFADLYRQEVASEEDVHRTLPFFGTALGIVIAILAYAAGRLPRWPDLVTPQAQEVFVASGVLLGLSIVEACCVLLWLTRAIARRVAPDIGPEPAFRARLNALIAASPALGRDAARLDEDVLAQMRRVLLDSYSSTTPAIRALNERRTRLRGAAVSHLMRSLIWALGATSVIFVSDKLGYLPKVLP